MATGLVVVADYSVLVSAVQIGASTMAEKEGPEEEMIILEKT